MFAVVWLAAPALAVKSNKAPAAAQPNFDHPVNALLGRQLVSRLADNLSKYLNRNKACFRKGAFVVEYVALTWSS